jgi:hypothetical protein
MWRAARHEQATNVTARHPILYSGWSIVALSRHRRTAFSPVLFPFAVRFAHRFGRVTLTFYVNYTCKIYYIINNSDDLHLLYLALRFIPTSKLKTVKSGRNLASILLTAADKMDDMRLVYLHSRNGVLIIVCIIYIYHCAISSRPPPANTGKHIPKIVITILILSYDTMTIWLYLLYY